VTSSFHNPTRVVFGPGAIEGLPDLMPEGPTCVVTSPGGASRGLTGRIVGLLGERATAIVGDVSPNPEIPDIIRHLDAVPVGTEVIVAAGGGSVMDTGKVLAALAKRRRCEGLSGPPPDLAAGKPVPTGQSLPVIAIPTTAGTGSEVTPFATVWDLERKRKHSVAGPGLFPWTALVDPELTHSLPRATTLASGLDALSQGFEAIWNRNAGPVTDALAIQAVRLALETVEPVCGALDDPKLRERMMQASLLAGLAISNTRTAIAHSISYPLTAHFGIPHGLACSFTLPAVLELSAGGDGTGLRQRLSAIGMGPVPELADRLRQLLRTLDVAGSLAEYGFDPGRVAALGPEMITPARAGNSIQDVTPDEAVDLVLRSWEALR